MEKISWSQVQIYNQCPFKWKLNYIDKIRPVSDSIYTIYGKALHEVLQTYLTEMYNDSITKADKLDLPNLLVDRVKFYYGDAVEARNGSHFSTQGELTEFCMQGAKALDWFKKRRGQYFSKKNWELMGIEVPLNTEYNGVKVLGFIDVLLRNKQTGKFRLIDIKTSTRGWKYEKKDPMKRGQLLFYKKFIAEKYDVDVSDIDVEFFIVKRLLWEKSDFPQKYIQKFEPPSANVSINKTFKTVDVFIDDCFNEDGSYKVDQDFKKRGVLNKCKWCEFADKPDICDKLYVEREDK
tara:strand:+ start:1616 stop:2494 length:879 start_codon:yes stop_codon:yes gene_type:complete